jgi:hypothetical protein
MRSAVAGAAAVGTATTGAEFIGLSSINIEPLSLIKIESSIYRLKTWEFRKRSINRYQTKKNKLSISILEKVPCGHH